MTSPEHHPPASWSLGIALLAVSLFLFAFLGRISDRGVGRNADPGPRMLPLLAAGCLAAGGLWEVTRAVRARRRAAAVRGDRETAAPGRVLQVLTLIGLLAAYVSLLPWIGFPAASCVFSLALMLQQRTPWWQAGIFSALLVAATYLLFVRVFSVPLPEGDLWMS